MKTFALMAMAMAMLMQCSSPAYAHEPGDGPSTSPAQISCGTIKASAIVAEGGNSLLTTAHFIRKCQKDGHPVKVLGFPDDAFSAPSPYVNDFADIAILGDYVAMHGRGTLLSTWDCSREPNTPYRNHLFSVGFPNGAPYEVNVVGSFKENTGKYFAAVDGYVAPGMSGAPVYDDVGRTVGMVRASIYDLETGEDANIYLMVRADAICKLVEEADRLFQSGIETINFVNPASADK